MNCIRSLNEFDSFIINLQLLFSILYLNEYLQQFITKTHDVI